MISDDKIIMNNLQRLKSKEGNAFERAMSLLKARPELKGAIDDLFSSEGGSAQDPLFEIRLVGDRPSNSSLSYLYRPEGITLQKMPLARYVDYVCDFLSLYNEEFQDRNRKVTQYSYIRYDQLLFPYVLASIIAGYTPNSTMGIRISFHYGIFAFTFRNKFGPSMNADVFIKSLIKDPMFEVLSSGLGVIGQDDFVQAFFNKRMTFTRESGGDFVTIQYLKDYGSRNNALKDRVLFLIDWTGGLSRKEIADYFQKSDRTMNNVLRELIDEGKIFRTGTTHDPTAKYKIRDQHDN